MRQCAACDAKLSKNPGRGRPKRFCNDRCKRVVHGRVKRRRCVQCNEHLPLGVRRRFCDQECSAIYAANEADKLIPTPDELFAEAIKAAGCDYKGARI